MSRYTVSKRGVGILIVIVVLSLLVVWFFYPSGGRNGDEARFRHLVRASRSLRWVSVAEAHLPAFVVRLFHLSDLEEKNWTAFQDERKALVTSGYFVELSVLAPNLSAGQTLSNLQMVFHAAGAYYMAQTETNSIVLTCRPEYKSLYEKAIANH
jgi:hypothetical protein